ncbi:MAG TPA: GrpB family protein, partial [Halococcus sp.]|nr:GrpB family protein [Halococcus sp.]
MTNIKLEPHQPIWVDRFERERDRLLAVTPDNPLGVFHIGSTAVPDLAAKPVLDVLAVFEGYDAARATADVLVMDGYELKHDQQDWVGLMRTTDEYSVYLHLRPRENETWRDQLVFRELLRDDPIA